MRWYWQIAIIAVLGGGGYYGWTNWDTLRPQLAQLPVVGPYIPQPQQQAAGGPPRGPGAGGPGGGGPPPVVEVVQIGTQRITEVTEAVGTTRAFESVSITSKVSGIVSAILFEEGQMVRAGQDLLRLDAAERQADLEAAQAAITTSQAQRAEILQRLERARQLRATGAGTEAVVADLTLQLRTSESNVVAAQARERASQARLDDLVVRAPFDGRVGVRQISIGALIEPRTAIATLDDLSRIRLDFSVPEVLLPRIAVGTPLRTQTIAYGNRTFAGEVGIIDTRIDPVTRSVRLTGFIANPDFLLRPGMFMNVMLEVATRPEAIVVPEEAIVGEGPRQILFIVAQNRVERRVVQLGQRQAGIAEVTDGARAGETIIVRGVQRVRHGMPVTPRPLGQAGQPPQGGPGQGQRPPGAPGPGGPGGQRPAGAPQAEAPTAPPAQAARPAQPASTN